MWTFWWSLPFVAPILWRGLSSDLPRDSLSIASICSEFMTKNFQGLRLLTEKDGKGENWDIEGGNTRAQNSPRNFIYVWHVTVLAAQDIIGDTYSNKKKWVKSFTNSTPSPPFLPTVCIFFIYDSRPYSLKSFLLAGWFSNMNGYSFFICP